MTRAASIKERGDELSPQQWHRFETAVAAEQTQQRKVRSAFGGQAGYFSSQTGGAEQAPSMSGSR